MSVMRLALYISFISRPRIVHFLSGCLVGLLGMTYPFFPRTIVSPVAVGLMFCCGISSSITLWPAYKDFCECMFGRARSIFALFVFTDTVRWIGIGLSSGFFSMLF